MKLKGVSCSVSQNSHLFKAEMSSGFLVLLVDNQEPMQFKFSETLKVHVTFDHLPLSYSNMCGIDKQNIQVISDPQLFEETSARSEYCHDDLSTVNDGCLVKDHSTASDFRNTNNKSNKSMNKPPRDTLFLNSSQKQDNGICVFKAGGVHEQSNILDVRSNMTRDIKVEENLNSYNRMKIERNEQRDEKQDQDLEMEVNDVGTNNTLETSFEEKDNMKWHLRSSKRLIKNSKTVQVIQRITRQRAGKNWQEIVDVKKKNHWEGSEHKKRMQALKRKSCKERERKKRVLANKVKRGQKFDIDSQDKKNEKKLSNSKCTDEKVDFSGQLFKQNSRLKKAKSRPRKLLLEKDVKCIYCGVTFETKFDYFNHRRLEGSSHTCEVCGKKEPYEALLLVHMQTHKPQKGHLVEEEKGDSKKLRKRRYKMKCDVCGLIVSSLDSLKIHTMIHTGEYPYKCCVCDDRFYSLSSLRHHLEVHRSPERIRCKQCNIRFASRAELAKHQFTHEIKCGLCGEIFPNKTVRNCHYRTAHPDDILKCEECFSQFATEAELQKHLIYHRNGKKEQCPECGVVVVKLKDHMLLHSRKEGEKLFACDQCSMRYLSKSTLDKHLLTHTGERPYACNKCPKCFRSQGMLRKHLLTHTLERKYVCDVCGKRCSLRSNLATHMRRHSNTRQYPCTFCSQAFNYKNSLKGHLQAKHANQNASSLFKCPHCSHTFQDNASLKSHIISKHSGAKLHEEVAVKEDRIEHLPTAITSQGEPIQMVIEATPPISNNLQVYHNGMDPNLRNALNMTNTSNTNSVPPMENATNLFLNRPTSNHLNSPLASNNVDPIAHGEMLKYLCKDRNTSFIPPPTVLPVPPPLHLLPMMSIDLPHSSSDNSLTQSLSQPHFPTHGPLNTKHAQDSSSLDDKVQYASYQDLS